MTSVAGAGELRLQTDARDEASIGDKHVGTVARRTAHEAAGPRIAGRRNGGNAEVRAERARLVRDLHDGILQALCGATLQLELIAGLIDTHPWVAKQRLRKIRQVLTEEQRELRKWVDDVRPVDDHVKTAIVDLKELLRRLCRRVEHQYGLTAELWAPASGTLSPGLAGHVCHIVQEGLTNVGRHALAKTVRVDLQIDARWVRIVIRDDGIGFPFQGAFDLAELVREDIGPRSLKERVVSLGGSLLLTSELTGSGLDITLPTACM